MFDPRAYDPSDFCDLSQEAVRLLLARGGQLFEGTLELMDDDVVIDMTNALWETARAGRDGSATPESLPFDLEALTDEELQDVSASILAATHEGPGFGFGGLSAAEASRAAGCAEDLLDPQVAASGPTA